MTKIKNISFSNHPVLGNLSLDFCNSNGSAVDTIIMAGENGTGKSTILQELYAIVSDYPKWPCTIEMEKDGIPFKLSFYYYENERLCFTYNDDETVHFKHEYKEHYAPKGIFSDVEINFTSSNISSVTSLRLDENSESRVSGKNLPGQIKQLLVDIQNLDANSTYDAFQKAKRNGDDANLIHPELRMPRFTKAFEAMFDDLNFDSIDNEQNSKTIYFRKNGIKIPIDNLSSGEKQIVFRGCFLLKDVNAMKGAVVFIDEPEISMHPTWQRKILDYYKAIYSNDQGEQTSQLFVVTHSPFIIHNENRKDDKVIVLKRENEAITVSDKNEYYKCDSKAVVEDAFSTDAFLKDNRLKENTVYVEGRTDEKYYKCAIETFGLKTNYAIKWIGSFDKNGNEIFTGETSMKQAEATFISNPQQFKVGFLYDSDVSHKMTDSDSVVYKVMDKYDNKKEIKKGIENALVLDDVDIDSFYIEKKKPSAYGKPTIINELQKMDLCNYICGLGQNEKEIIFRNLKYELESMNELML